MARIVVHPGMQAPEFALPSAAEGTVSLADYRGQATVVLIFLRDRR